MNEKTPFQFSRFLSEAEQTALSDLRNWAWISTFGLCTVKPIRHRRHEKWLKQKGNTHSPGRREILLMLRGEAIYSLNGKCYLRRPGTVVLMDRHEVRDLQGAPDKVSFSCLWLHLYTPDYLTYYINTGDAQGRYSHDLPMRVKKGDNSRLILAAWDQCLAQPENDLCRTLLQSLVISTLLEVLGTDEIERPEDQHRQIVESIKDYITSHLQEDLSLQNLSILAGYSPFFFHRLFRKHTGKTPVQYVNAARLERSIELLNAGYKVEAVAEAVGFSSSSYFNQFFRKTCRTTPGRWQRANQKKPSSD